MIISTLTHLIFPQLKKKNFHFDHKIERLVHLENVIKVIQP